MRIPLRHRYITLKVIFRYHWEYYWNLIYHWSAWSSGTEWYIQILLLEITTETSIYIIPLNINCMYHRNNIYHTYDTFKYHWNKISSLNGPMVFPNTIEKTTEVWFIVERYMFRYHWHYHWNVIYHWVVQWYIVEKYVPIPLRVPLKQVLSLSSPMVFNGILKYHWEYHWSLIYCWKVCSDTIESTIETSFIIE